MECPRRAETGDPKSMVVAILVGPFTMIDQPRRNLLELKTHNRVRADHHRIAAPAELANDAREYAWAGIDVVAIELHRVPATMARFDCLTPAPADAKVRPLGHEVHQSRLAVGQSRQGFSRPIR